MNSVIDYQITEKIYESSNSLIYRAMLSQKRQPVILKILKQDYPTPSELTRYKQEYEITCQLSEISGVIKTHEMQPYKNTLAILLEDFGAQSLKELLQLQCFSIMDFLAVATDVCETLGQIHANGVIHKDINPSNIVLNLQSNTVKIIDFGISTSFDREKPSLKNPEILEGTLAYISPEQTGRMNRFLDYRTDFYSLGVTFYELLTQQLPFEANDPLELIHFHIAKTPVPLNEIKPEIPVVLSSIVMKLLAKTAEERYQSAWGIKADLENCLQFLQTQDSIPDFPLATHDQSDRFQIPQKLYGRAQETKVLLDSFERIASGRAVELLLVAGYSGIGKSALVQELYKPVTKQRGYFISGKFDQFQRNIPYSAVVKAFRSLGRQILTENRDRLEFWKNDLLKAVGVNGQVIIDVLPEFEQIIGPQPPTQTLEPIEAKNLFKTVFQAFIGVFCKSEHPLVVFLDDLQWADSASLNFIELMLNNSDIGYLLIIGAYRDNEVNSNHPLMNLLSRLEEERISFITITLQPLKNEHLGQLVGETLNRSSDSINSLIRLVENKTSGNPFFVNEILNAIYRERLLQFNYDQGVWQWDIDQIEGLGITENVVDLMVHKMRGLPTSAQQALSLSACIGNSFNIDTLSVIFEKTIPETFTAIKPAIHSGLIEPISELEISSEKITESSLFIREYKFLHDRIQQAAYALIEDDRKQGIHLKIAKLLSENFSTLEREENIFDLVNHFNKGRELLVKIEEKIDLAKLNLAAGIKAKKAIAFGPAKEYLNIALNQLPKNMWSEQYELSLNVHQELSDTEYLNGNFEQSQALIKQAIKRARTAVDQTKFYVLLIVQYTLMGQYLEAIQSGTDALKRLGVSLPTGDFDSALQAEVQIILDHLNGQEIDSLYNLPEIEDQEKKSVLILLEKMFSAAWSGEPELTHVLIAKQVRFSIEYGFDRRTSAIGYGYFAVTHSHVLHEYKRGYQFAALGLKLSEKFNDLFSKSSAACTLANMGIPWVKHLKYSEHMNAEATDAGLQSGSPQYAGYSMGYGLLNQVYQGKNLEQLYHDSQRYLRYFIETKNLFFRDVMIGLKFALTSLLGLADDSFRIEHLDEEMFVKDCQVNHSGPLCIYYLHKALVSYICRGEIDLNHFQEVERLVGYVPGSIAIAMNNFYYSLSLTFLYSKASFENQRLFWEKLQENQRWMKIWQDNCPENFLHQSLLVEAEMARISGNLLVAMALYDRSIKSAREQEFVHHEAIANELAADFWFEMKKDDFAELYLRRCHQNYQIWGAKYKVQLLEKKYPFLSTSTNLNVDITTQNFLTTTSSGNLKISLDLETVFKSYQAISSEIVLANLLAELMKIAIENAGARQGFLLLEKDNSWMIEAEGLVEADEVLTGQLMTAGSNQERLSYAIVNYVARTQESVVLDNAASEGQFIQDPYILKNQTKSVLCTPLLNRGNLSGILYLENNLTPGAFTPDRVELLQVLSSQAAISLENSILYRTLEDKVEERTKELSRTLDILKDTQAKLVFENDLLRSTEQSGTYNYQLGGSLPLDAPTYVVRAADRYLYKGLIRGELCYILNARQMGKSSLMVRMMHQLQQEGNYCAVIDVTCLGSSEVTLAQWYKGFAVELWQALDLSHCIALSRWWKERQDLPVVQRLGLFFDEILRILADELEQSDCQVVILLDEIDYLFSLNFPVDDFFFLIRSLHNQRAINPLYKRLTFALFGVAAPANLISDRKRAPFNIGHAIELSGFQAHEAQPLLHGLSEKVENPQTLLKEVLFWTGGQPFLTQKVCQMIRDTITAIPANTEAQWIENLIQTRIIDSWETQDDPQHLRTIRDRLLESDLSAQLLSLYQEVLEQKKINAIDSPQERELLLTGIIVKQAKQLKVYNRIYARVFDLAWISACQR